MSSLAERVASAIRTLAPKPEFATVDGLMVVFRGLARWRSRMLAHTILNLNGTVVQSGPFAGMDYVSYSTEGCLTPRLIGTYESELHPTILAAAAAEYDDIIDIGCAEGYYAVGLARLAPGATVHAFDIDARAVEACKIMAERNGVADRVIVGGEFSGEDFDAFAGRKVLLVVDIEGAEDELLLPDAWPALKQMSLVVETHDCFRPGLRARLMERFGPSHDIEVLWNRPAITYQPEWLRNLETIDHLAAIYEWRTAPTPWLVMHPKAKEPPNPG